MIPQAKTTRNRKKNTLTKDSYSYTSVSNSTDVFTGTPLSVTRRSSFRYVCPALLSSHLPSVVLAWFERLRIRTHLRSTQPIHNDMIISSDGAERSTNEESCKSTNSSVIHKFWLRAYAKCTNGGQLCVGRAHFMSDYILKFGTVLLLTISLIIAILFWIFCVFDVPKTSLVVVLAILSGMGNINFLIVSSCTLSEYFL